MNFIKNSLMSMVALVALTSVAVATDLPTKKGPPPAPTAIYTPYDWSGPYLGLNAGVTIPNSLHNSVDAYGGLAGIDAGYNYQYNHYVLGVQGNVDYTKINQFNQPNAVLTSADLLAGYSFDRFLPYVKGGAAYYSQWNNNVGWNLGAGLKYALTYNIGLFSEYDYYNLGVFNGNKLNTSVVRTGFEYKF